MKISSVAILVAALSIPLADVGAETAPLADVVNVGARPYFLLDKMKPSSVKDKLEECARTKTTFTKSDFSLGHRGAPLQFPEHTIDGYKAAALMGAGIIECDVTFTKDLELVCRHSQCDLHRTTDVVNRPELNAKCTVPFETGVEPNCCTSDFTLEEIKTLCAKMDATGNVNATDPADFVNGGTDDWRTDLYQNPCHTIPTHKEYIELIKSYKRKFTPELKEASVEMPFDGSFTQEIYAQKMIDEYVEAGIDPSEVWPQSFYVDDVIYWVKNTDFGDQAVALHEVNETETEYRALHKMLQENGVKVVAPPLFMMVEYDETSELGIIASPYGASAKENGLSIIAWSLERDSPALDGWYWSTLQDLNRTVGDNLALLHVLSEEVGVMAVFSDWPATTTFYANCMGLGLDESAPPETAESSESGSTGGIEEVGDFEDVTGIMEKDTEAASSGKGEQRHLKAASQLLNIALKLVGI